MKQRDHLLHVLSARGKVTYAQFKELLQGLYQFLPVKNGSETERPVAFIASQSLEALGHCNLDFEGGSSKMYTCQPSLNRLPTGGSPTGVLSGARPAETMALLTAASEEIAPGSIDIDATPASNELPFIPLRIEVRASESSLLERFAGEVGLSYRSAPRALQIASRLGTIEEYLESLGEPRTGELENWPGRRIYHPEIFRFRQIRPDGGSLHLVRYNHPHKGGRHYFLFRGNKRQEIDREWGRYAVLRETSLRPLIHDKRRMLVAVPNGARLPGLQARALSLCSGYAPEFFETSQISISSRLQVPKPEQFGYHMYRWVDPRVFQAVAESLGQTPLEAEIRVPEARSEKE